MKAAALAFVAGSMLTVTAQAETLPPKNAAPLRPYSPLAAASLQEVPYVTPAGEAEALADASFIAVKGRAGYGWTGQRTEGVLGLYKERKLPQFENPDLARISSSRVGFRWALKFGS